MHVTPDARRVKRRDRRQPFVGRTSRCLMVTQDPPVPPRGEKHPWLVLTGLALLSLVGPSAHSQAARERSQPVLSVLHGSTSGLGRGTVGRRHQAPHPYKHVLPHLCVSKQPSLRPTHASPLPTEESQTCSSVAQLSPWCACAPSHTAKHSMLPHATSPHKVSTQSSPTPHNTPTDPPSWPAQPPPAALRSSVCFVLAKRHGKTTL